MLFGSCETKKKQKSINSSLQTLDQVFPLTFSFAMSISSNTVLTADVGGYEAEFDIVMFLCFSFGHIGLFEIFYSSAVNSNHSMTCTSV